MPQYAAVVAEVVEPFLAIFPVPLPPGALKPAIKGETCFMGIAVVLQPEHASFDFWFPGKAANQIYKMYVVNFLKGGAQ